jgi:hypothetical protein
MHAAGPVPIGQICIHDVCTVIPQFPPPPPAPLSVPTPPPPTRDAHVVSSPN